MFSLFIANLKLLFRNRQQLFWSLAFPLIFTVIFGFFFSGGNTNAGTVGLVNKADTQLSQELVKSLEASSSIKLQEETDISRAKDLLKKSKLNAIISIPEGFGGTQQDSPKALSVIYDPANQQSGAVVMGFLQSYLTQVNFQLQNARPIYTVSQESSASGSFNYFDFILVGLLGMALMNSSIQGIAISMSKYREDKILKRITTTPLPGWVFVASEVLARLVLNFLQISLILAVGVYGFHATLHGSITTIYVLALFGAILFQSIGFTIAGLTKTTQAAEGMATAIAIPMMFLAGVFFPIDQLPKWLYSIVQYLPLAPLLRVMRAIILENASPLDNPTSLALIVAWIVVCLGFASLRFRLTEE